MTTDQHHNEEATTYNASAVATCTEATIDHIFLAFHATWGQKWSASMENPRNANATRNLWIKKLRTFTPQVVSQVLDSLIISGQAFPPTLPEMFKMCSDISKQEKLHVDEKRKKIECARTQNAADKGFRDIMAILKK